MGTDPKLESYLAKLERVLGPFPASDRAEIVTEIKSHVLSALERDPTTRIENVLASFGEPETVANRYLVERGMKPVKPPLSPVIKWLVIGFLGSGAMVVALLSVVVVKFSPLIKVDEKHDYVSLLGGAVEISGDEGTIKVNSSVIHPELDFETDRHEFSGSWTPPRPQDKIAVNFKNGRVELSNADDGKVSWRCRGHGHGHHAPSLPTPAVAADGNANVLDLPGQGVKCKFTVPENLGFALNGRNGKIVVLEPHFDVELSLHSGAIGIAPDDEAKYRYSLSVQTGQVDPFESTSGANVHAISAHLNSGRISRLTDEDNEE